MSMTCLKLSNYGHVLKRLSVQHDVYSGREEKRDAGRNTDITNGDRRKKLREKSSTFSKLCNEF